ncbi:hypothetical protein HME9302_01698 [Alteripontixanthobacter maritimus]|uniref:Uncharacterized protein n=1 Tax=Alteripontixanthobacter maritimus TaxID=2161824 RepID=A0A369Q7Z1_9SPHN|nr:hypothetical protein [Alteripontixanthobacter maritimus]RDC60490.1 hypothetical protein HME9302_01698 [Alteripontixanthobacter maritimus]
MTKRIVTSVAALAGIALASPAAAQGIEDTDTAEAAAVVMAERMRDPAVQDRMVGVLADLMDAMLDVKVGPLAETLEEFGDEPVEGIDRDATLRDLAGPDAEDIPADVAEELPRAMDAMAGMTKGLAAMLPALREMAKTTKESLLNDSRF